MINSKKSTHPLESVSRALHKIMEKKIRYTEQFVIVRIDAAGYLNTWSRNTGEAMPGGKNLLSCLIMAMGVLITMVLVMAMVIVLVGKLKRTVEQVLFIFGSYIW